MGMYLEAKHLEDLLSFGWDIVVENTSNPPGTVVMPNVKIAPNDVVNITMNIPLAQPNTSELMALRDLLKRGLLTLINENSWEHEEYDSKNRRRDAILAQKARHGKQPIRRQ